MFNRLTAIALGLALANSAHAAIMFDPDGTGLLPAFEVTTFNWAPSAFLAAGGVSAIQTRAAVDFVMAQENISEAAALAIVQNANPDASLDFDLFTHARLNQLSTTTPGAFLGGLNTNLPAPLNNFYPAFEITFVAGFGETVTDLTSGVDSDGNATSTATFGLRDGVGTLTSGATPFLEMYFTPGLNSDAQTGDGFANNGIGQRILRLESVAQTGTSVFETTFVGNPVSTDPDDYGALDQTLDGVDRFLDPDTGDTIKTVSGSSTALALTAFDVAFIDSAFFVGGLSSLDLVFSNLSFQVPFIAVDPSSCFNDRSSPTLGQGICEGPDGIQMAVGEINGLSGPDFTAQVTTNASPTGTAVPEPGTLTLLGLGLIGLAVRRRA